MSAKRSRLTFNMLGNAPVEVIVCYILVLFLGIGIHEYAHCKFADMAGDPTPRYYGRVTLNLFKHFEPVGTLMMVISAFAGVGIGWGRPAPMDSSKMKNPRWDLFIAVAAGPISNICQAILYAFLLRILMMNPQLIAAYPIAANFLFIGVGVNVSLFAFNLIPFGPLDGHWLVGLLLPEKARYGWFRFNQQVGLGGLVFFVIALRVIPGLQETISGPQIAIARFLTGVKL